MTSKRLITPILINIDNFFNNDIIMSSLLKKLSVSIKIHVVKQTQKQTQTQSVWPVSKLSIESVGSRRELVANSCTHRRRRRDATKQFRRVGCVYWVLRSHEILPASESLASVVVCRLVDLRHGISRFAGVPGLA